jgi:5,10-methylenetetrahydrofolate reductase
MFQIAHEITPPKRPRHDILLRRARLLQGRADTIHVIQRPERWSSLECSIALVREGVHAVWHAVNRGRSEDEIRHDIERALEGGVRSVLCLRGEHDAIDKSDTPRLRELVGWLRSADPDLRIGVTANQYGPIERVLENLLPKLDAGADFVQTQPVFAAEDLEPLIPAVHARAPHVRIQAMLMPLTSEADAHSVAARLGVPVPESVLAALHGGGVEAGWREFADLLLALRDLPGIDGVALMTLRADPAPEDVARIRDELDRL